MDLGIFEGMKANTGRFCLVAREVVKYFGKYGWLGKVPFNCKVGTKKVGGWRGDSFLSQSELRSQSFSRTQRQSSSIFKVRLRPSASVCVRPRPSASAVRLTLQQDGCRSLPSREKGKGQIRSEFGKGFTAFTT